MVDASRTPLRRCLATGQSLEKDQMIRFVLGPNNEVVPDLVGKLPGRGLWITANRAALEKAIAKNLFAKAAKAKVNVDPELPANLDDLLRKQSLNLLGLARRAGEVVNGFEKTKALLNRGGKVVLIAACDGSQDGRNKLKNLLQRSQSAASMVEIFAVEELSEALGRENVVHAGMIDGGLARRFVNESLKLAAYRNME